MGLKQIWDKIVLLNFLQRILEKLCSSDRYKPNSKQVCVDL